jgi:hypothetical protein
MEEEKKVLSVLGVMRDPTPRDKVFVTMDHSGDKKEIWDPDNRDEVDAARETYNRLVKKGYLAFKVKRDAEKGSQIHEFDPDAGKMILCPPVVGG